MKKAVVKEKDKATLTHVYQLWGWILLIWSLYRYFLKLPEWIDEFIAKPLVFIAPVIWFVTKFEKRRLPTVGLTVKKLFPSLYIGLGFGLVFALEGITANAIKYGKLSFNPIAVVDQYGLILMLILSLATSFSEELLNRGFLFTRILEKTKSLPHASLMSTILFVLLHVPILVTTLKLQGLVLVLYFVTDFVLGLTNSLLFYHTSSLVAPILVHLFWNMTVALYL